MHTLAQFLLTFPGMAVVAVLVPMLAARWFLAPGDRKRTEWMLVAAILVEPMSIASQLTANALTVLRPAKYDLYVYQFDLAFGEPSFRLGTMAWHHLWLHNLISVSYGLLPVVMLVVFGAHLLLSSELECIRVLKAFALLFLGAAPLYLLLPVCGPVYAFSQFPNLPASVIAHPLLLNAPPNGVPSCHTGAALLSVWFLWRWRWGKALGLTFLALTALATLGSGQHYLFDLLCAVPYAAIVLTLVTWPARAPQLQTPFTLEAFHVGTQST